MLVTARLQGTGADEELSAGALPGLLGPVDEGLEPPAGVRAAEELRQHPGARVARARGAV